MKHLATKVTDYGPIVVSQNEWGDIVVEFEDQKATMSRNLYKVVQLLGIKLPDIPEAD